VKKPFSFVASSLPSVRTPEQTSNPNGPTSSNSLFHVLRRETSGQKQRDADALADRATDTPIMSSAGAA
jgi:hypothetical protein